MMSLFEASDFSSFKDLKCSLSQIGFPAFPLVLDLSLWCGHWRSWLFTMGSWKGSCSFHSAIAIHGYVNDEGISMYHFAHGKLYVSDIRAYVESGDLSAEKEFYSPVRFRGQKRKSRLSGTRHYLLGTAVSTSFWASVKKPWTQSISFSWLCWLDDVTDSDTQLQAAHASNDAVALAHPWRHYLQGADICYSQAMENVIQHFHLTTPTVNC